MCNHNLPRNSLSVTDIQKGMEIYTFSDPTVRTVEKVSGSHIDRTVVFTDGTRSHMRTCGTVRLVDTPEYDYHAGHTCGHDCASA